MSSDNTIDLKLKHGSLSNIDSVDVENGAIYFAKDDNYQNGKIYYDTPTGEGRIDVSGAGYVLENGAEIFNDYRKVESIGTAGIRYKGNQASGNFSHAEGTATAALGEVSHAENMGTLAEGNTTHAEGYFSEALGDVSHAEGFETVSRGDFSHAEGHWTISGGDFSHVEGDESLAAGESSHAEGRYTLAVGPGSHAEGGFCIDEETQELVTGSSIAFGISSHAEGSQGVAFGHNSHAEGFGGQAIGGGSHVEGVATAGDLLGRDLTQEEITDIRNNLVKSLFGKEPEEELTDEEISILFARMMLLTSSSTHQAVGWGSHAEGIDTNAIGEASHTEGYLTKAERVYDHAEGWFTQATGGCSHAGGYWTKALGSCSHAEGGGVWVEGQFSHGEGCGSVAKGDYSHVEGYGLFSYSDDVPEEEFDRIAQKRYELNYDELNDGQKSIVEAELTLLYPNPEERAIGDYTHAEGYRTQAIGHGSHAEGYYAIASGDGSHAEGGLVWDSSANDVSSVGVQAIGQSSHAEGGGTIALKSNAHAEGAHSQALGTSSHAEGDTTIAKGAQSHAEGSNTQALGHESHSEGYYSKAILNNSHAEGNNTIAIGKASHAEGYQTAAWGYRSHVEGYSGAKAESLIFNSIDLLNLQEKNLSSTDFDKLCPSDTVITDTWKAIEDQGLRFSLAKGHNSHVEGANNLALGANSHVEGYYNIVNGEDSHVEGRGNTSHSNSLSAHVGGRYSDVQGTAPFAHGYRLKAGSYQAVFGKWSKEVNDINANTANGSDNSSSTDEEVKAKLQDSIFIIGNGTGDSQRRNVFRVSWCGSTYLGGKIGSTTPSYSTSGADFAEFFEWIDQNPKKENRLGLLVTLDGNKIRPANLNDTYILGAITSSPGFVGNAASEEWQGMYLTDVFGSVMTEEVKIEESIDEDTGEIIPAHTDIQPILNPEYDSTKNYISREFRSEWALVGLCGQVVIVDDGTCKVNGYCRPYVDGIASEFTIDNIDENIPDFMKEFYISTKGFRVMERLDENHIRIMLK